MPYTAWYYRHIRAKPRIEWIRGDSNLVPLWICNGLGVETYSTNMGATLESSGVQHGSECLLQDQFFPKGFPMTPGMDPHLFEKGSEAWAHVSSIMGGL